MFDPPRAYEKIKKYPVISFDIFDTLVKRNVPEPQAIFDVMEEKFNRRHPEGGIRGFREKRIQAERTARQLGDREEITFQQIYDQMDLSPELREEWMWLETETELQYCLPNYMLKELYDRCTAEGHIVVIASDMYLPRELVAQILENCGYLGYKKLYLSSEIGLRKRTGNLFDHMMRDLGVPARDIVHIGDGKRTDNLVPRRKGMGSLYIERQQLNTHFLREEVFSATNCPLYSFLNNNLPKYRSRSPPPGCCRPGPRGRSRPHR